MKKKKKIIFDVDGVLSDFVVPFTQLAKDMGFVDKTWSTTEQKYYDFRPLTPDQVKVLFDAIVESRDFWETLPPLVNKETFVSIDELCHEESVLFATARNSDAKDPGEQTHRWLINQGICHPNVIVTKRKGDVARAFEADYLIDDKLENAWAVHWISDSPQTKVYLLDQPYNQCSPDLGPKKVTRIYSVDEFITTVLEGK